MKVIVYCTTNIVNKFIYIGVHLLKENEKSFYLGCGVYADKPYTYEHPKTKFQAAVKEFGPKNFKRVTIKEFDNEEDAYFMESELVDENFLKRSDVYNMVLGGKIGIDNSKKCYQYSLEGNFIREYDSLANAGECVHRASGTILYAINNKVKSSNSFWSFEKLDKLDLSSYKTTSNRVCVYQYSLSGEYDCCYESVADAARLNNSVSTNISRACEFGYIINNKYFSYNFSPTFIKAKKESTRGKKVYQYSLNGTYIAEYNSCNAAEIAIGAARGLSTAIKLGRIFHGFQWRFEKLPSIDSVKDIHSKPRKVGQYDLSGNLLKIYDTVTECRKDFSGCRHVLSGRNKTSGGYIFKYIED